MIFEVILACWHPDPDLRPTMAEVAKLLRFADEESVVLKASFSAGHGDAVAREAEKQTQVSAAVSPSPVSSPRSRLKELLKTSSTLETEDGSMSSHGKRSGTDAKLRLEERHCSECGEVGMHR